ncbi:unnamed protein product [Polarella glacialis]|uniref:Fe2OG dioxygenase domain-containing protein n=1 Tax=Polarella glacialis TaxID=89957 RepID=A0A813GJN6_POLGL|nr:unnamed protein product [Polarella glacialis]
MTADSGNTSVLVPQPLSDELEQLVQEAVSIDVKELLAEDGLPELDERTGRPKVLKAYVVHADPKMTVVPNFLSDEEIKHLLELSEDYWVQSMVGTGVYKTNDESKDLQNKPSPNRTSYSCMLRSSQTDLVRDVEFRLAQLAGIQVDYLERLNMVRYEPGQLFNRHHDGRFRPKTVFVYLNDLPENAGGETFFPNLGIKFVPRKGCAVMWSNVLGPGVDDERTIHQGLPPRTGIKFGVNCFFNDKPIKQMEAARISQEEDGLRARAARLGCKTFDPEQLFRDDVRELLPGQIRAFSLNQEPKLSVIPGFLNEDEASALAAMTQPAESRPVIDESCFARIEQKMALVAGLPQVNMEPLKGAQDEVLIEEFFKKGDILKAADCYYHTIVYCRDLTQNPQYYPDLKHTQEQRQSSKDLCESVFTNLALCQLKYAATFGTTASEERTKVLKEGAKSASEALKLNPKNAKALFRRAAATASLAQGNSNNEEAQQLCLEARADFLQVIEVDPQNREARVELKAVQELVKALKREEAEGEKKGWLRAEAAPWLQVNGATKCVVHMRCSTVAAEGSHSAPVTLSFILGDPDMHEGFHVAVKSMTVGEVASFTFSPSRFRATGSLVKLLPSTKEAQAKPSVWEITFLKYVTWEDLDCKGQRLRKIHSEGYGPFPEHLAEIFVHWKVVGPDNSLLHSSRYTLSMGADSGMSQVEDEDKPAPSYVLGEGAWEPISTLCRSLRQGGAGELWMRCLPAMPVQESLGNGMDASAQLSMMLNKAKEGASQDSLEHCVVRVELEKVVPPLAGPSDARWEGPSSVVQERFRAAQLLEKGDENAALARLRRVAAWCPQLSASEGASVSRDLGEARSGIGWILACRAAPILDSGSVTSDLIALAKKDLAEAEAHCKWLEVNHPDLAGTRLLRSKILLALDDDFAGAHEQLLEAQRSAPDNKTVQLSARHLESRRT